MNKKIKNGFTINEMMISLAFIVVVFSIFSKGANVFHRDVPRVYKDVDTFGVISDFLERFERDIEGADRVENTEKFPFTIIKGSRRTCYKYDKDQYVMVRIEDFDLPQAKITSWRIPFGNIDYRITHGGRRVEVVTSIDRKVKGQYQHKLRRCSLFYVGLDTKGLRQ